MVGQWQSGVVIVDLVHLNKLLKYKRTTGNVRMTVRKHGNGDRLSNLIS